MGLRPLAALALALASCASPAPPVRAEYIRHDGSAALPFSQAVRVGDLLFLSGQIGTKPGDFSAVVPGGIE